MRGLITVSSQSCVFAFCEGDSQLGLILHVVIIYIYSIIHIYIYIFRILLTFDTWILFGAGQTGFVHLMQDLLEQSQLPVSDLSTIYAMSDFVPCLYKQLIHSYLFFSLSLSILGSRRPREVDRERERETHTHTHLYGPCWHLL